MQRRCTAPGLALHWQYTFPTRVHAQDLVLARLLWSRRRPQTVATLQARSRDGGSHLILFLLFLGARLLPPFKGRMRGRRRWLFLLLAATVVRRALPEATTAPTWLDLRVVPGARRMLPPLRGGAGEGGAGLDVDHETAVAAALLKRSPQDYARAFCNASPDQGRGFWAQHVLCGVNVCVCVFVRTRLRA